MNIPCLACHGRGWISVRDWRNLPYPAQCAACHGTGTQTVKS